jgi:IPT/TIG domain-containing protein
VTIFGEGFDEPLTVDFGTLRQQVLSVTGNQILVRTVPLLLPLASCTNQSLPVTVRHLETNQTAVGPSFTYLVAQFAPTIISTIPSVLSQNPGEVTINGTNFRQQLQVTFDGRPVIVSTISNNQIVGTFPSIPNGSFDTEQCDDNHDNFLGERFVITPFNLVVTDLETRCTDTLSVNVRPADQSCRNDVAPTPTPTTPPPTATPQPTPTNTPLS